MNDFFHLLQQKATTHAAADNAGEEGVQEGRVRVGHDLLAGAAAPSECRPVLKSVGWLVASPAHEARERLAPECTERNTQRISVGDMREKMHICRRSCSCLCTGPTFWHRTGHRLRSLEAFHSPRQKQLSSLGKSATALEVQAMMQELSMTWERQSDWTCSDALYDVSVRFGH